MVTSKVVDCTWVIHEEWGLEDFDTEWTNNGSSNGVNTWTHSMTFTDYGKGRMSYKCKLSKSTCPDYHWQKKNKIYCRMALGTEGITYNGYPYSSHAKDPHTTVVDFSRPPSAAVLLMVGNFITAQRLKDGQTTNPERTCYCTDTDADYPPLSVSISEQRQVSDSRRASF